MREQTIEKLYAMKLNGMAEAYDEQRRQPEAAELGFDERLGMLVDRQWVWKENRALAARLQFAGFKVPATLEEVDYRHARGLERGVMQQLASCQWILHRRNCLITGPTGLGKSFLACALGHQACREGHRVLYTATPKLFRTLAQAQADGNLTKYLKTLERVDLLVIDDWGLVAPKPDHARLFLEVIDDRQGATLITSQYPVEAWHELIGDPTVADAILDRVVHNAYRIALQGESLRKRRGLAVDEAHHNAATRPSGGAGRR
jgi:DNA replication protein DnaC